MSYGNFDTPLVEDFKDCVRAAFWTIFYAALFTGFFRVALQDDPEPREYVFLLTGTLVICARMIASAIRKAARTISSSEKG